MHVHVEGVTRLARILTDGTGFVRIIDVDKLSVVTGFLVDVRSCIVHCANSFRRCGVAAENFGFRRCQIHHSPH